MLSEASLCVFVHSTRIKCKCICYMPASYEVMAYGLLLADTLTNFHCPLRLDQTCVPPPDAV